MIPLAILIVILGGGIASALLFAVGTAKRALNEVRRVEAQHAEILALLGDLSLVSEDQLLSAEIKRLEHKLPGPASHLLRRGI